MKPEELLRNIERDKYDPVYLFDGEEEFLKEETLRLLLARIVDQNTRDFNYDCLYAGEVEAAAVVDIATAFPLMAERRLVIFRDIQHCSTKDWKALLSYAARPCPTTCLVLVGPKLDLSKGSPREMTRLATAVTFWPLFDNQVPTWVKKHSQRRGKRITAEAVQLLQNAVGSSLQPLSNEIDKLVAFCAERDTIEGTDVETVVGVTRTNSVFDLADQLGRGKLSLSLQTLRLLLEAGESEVGLVWMLTRHYMILTKIGQVIEKPVSDQVIARTMRLRPTLVPSYVQQARRFSPASLEKAFTLLLKADTDLKSGQQDPSLVMETLAVALCRLQAD